MSQRFEDSLDSEKSVEKFSAVRLWFTGGAISSILTNELTSRMLVKELKYSWQYSSSIGGRADQFFRYRQPQ